MKKILVVDDDAIFREIIKNHLVKMGFAVIENDSGRGVNEQVLKEQPVACLIDMVMDKKDGVETITQLREILNGPKIIGVSSSKFYAEVALSLGADSMLTKPILPAQLEEAFTRLGIHAEDTGSASL